MNIMGSVPEQYCLPSSIPPAIITIGMNIIQTKMSLLFIIRISLEFYFGCKITHFI